MRNSESLEQDSQDETASRERALPFVRRTLAQEQPPQENLWERIRHPYVTSLQQWIDMNG